MLQLEVTTTNNTIILVLSSTSDCSGYDLVFIFIQTVVLYVKVSTTATVTFMTGWRLEARHPKQTWMTKMTK